MTSWKENVMMYIVYTVGGMVMGAGIAALTLWLLTFLGVEL